jgi:hypothetical protein
VNFSLHHRVQTGSGSHAASYPMGTRGSFLGVKRPVSEADHSPSSSVEVRNAWLSAQLQKHRDKFAFFTFTCI